MLHPKNHSDSLAHYLSLLESMRAAAGERQTVGLSEQAMAPFIKDDPRLCQAIVEAAEIQQQLMDQFPELMRADEATLVAALQHRLINFYAADAVNNYVALAAQGPWLITHTGAVLHDSGGYGMLGLGHNPEAVLAAMSKRQVMANIMTPNFSQRRFTDALEKEIGQTRADGCPYRRFVCMNSGSEAMTVALRIADVNAKKLTDANGRHQGKALRRLSLQNSFHGRTDRPARYSDSTRGNYVNTLASFRDSAGPITVEPNNIAQLREVFQMADEQGFFIEALCMEPVMGEGNPGLAITREFYDVARELTLDHGTVLVIDSIQAGLRTHGVLSLTDYPGFADCAAPDIESFSKALNAGQYPLSVLGMNQRSCDMYEKGIYGNTMTANPRALDIACVVLDQIDDKLRHNIAARGQEFVQQLQDLADELDGAITAVQGTGLLVSCELDQARYKCYGSDSIEAYMRTHGLGVIHGGKHSLRFTPPFSITSAEISMIVAGLRNALRKGPKKH